ncbi:hypothetical protein GGR57DRAFT_511691 [Xylariaceae sp. FL1272]|nr:hypothetical protein GGR57DRAFT_511691 [Xylariaceae sp. FL1272]
MASDRDVYDIPYQLALSQLADERHSNSVVGIDFGSTTTRAVVYDRVQDKRYNVENEEPSCARHREGEFASIGYPFEPSSKENAHVWLGNRPTPKRTGISLKYAFYLLADPQHNIGNEYDVVKPILDYKDDHQFCSRLEQGIRELFSRIRDRIQTLCNKHNFKLCSVMLSTPAQWDLDFEAVYRRLISQVFGLKPSQISFITEIVALAQFMCKENPEFLVGQDEDTDRATSLFIDAGGHTCSTLIAKSVHQPASTPTFYACDDALAAPGGSEVWEYHVAKTCIALIEMEIEPSRRFSAEDRQNLLDDFNHQKSWLLRTDKPETFTDTFTWRFFKRDGEKAEVRLGFEDVKHCFHQALQKPIALMSRKIQEAAENSPDSRVIVTGGTSRHELFRSIVKNLCKASKLTNDPVFVAVDNDWGIQYYNMRIAQGAAFAAAGLKTIQNFLEGAVLCLQMRQGTKSSSNPTDQEWDSIATRLLANGHSEVVDTYLTGHDGVRLVGDPFDEGHNVVPVKRCFNVLDLGIPLQGHWQFELTVIEPGGSTKLEFTARRRLKVKGRLQEAFNRSWVFPLHINRGTNTLHIGEEDQDITGFSAKIQHALANSYKETSRRRNKPDKTPRPEPRNQVTEPTVASKPARAEGRPQEPPYSEPTSSHTLRFSKRRAPDEEPAKEVVTMFREHALQTFQTQTAQAQARARAALNLGDAYRSSSLSSLASQSTYTMQDRGDQQQMADVPYMGPSLYDYSENVTHGFPLVPDTVDNPHPGIKRERSETPPFDFTAHKTTRRSRTGSRRYHPYVL